MTAPQIQGLNSQGRREGPQKVFVYGTLKKGYHNHKFFLDGCRDLGPATIEGLMFHLGGFPAINLAENFCTIHGEVYEVEWSHIERMDHLEGIDRGFYARIQATVKPHGVVWMYIFPHQKAALEEFIIPGGRWQGVDTNKVKWEGFGKGVEVGTFEARLAYPGEIKIGPGKSNYVLRRSGGDDLYKLIDKSTGEILGAYKTLGDMTSNASTTRKSVLRLPATSRSSETSAAETTVAGGNRPVDQHPNTPIVWSPQDREEEAPKEELIPQAARLLGIKYGEA